MKKIVSILAVAALLAMPFALAAVPFDLPTSQTVMRGNAARVQAIKTALASQDYLAAAGGFFDYAKAAAQMSAMDPPKGNADDWRKTWAAFQDAALKGVGACGERDASKAQKSLDELLGFMKFGHSTYR